MKDYTLPQDELAELKAAHKSVMKMRSHLPYRIHVIILLGMGMSPSEVSDILFFSEDTRTCLKNKNHVKC